MISQARPLQKHSKTEKTFLKDEDLLFNFGFLTLNVLVLFAFSNLAIFYSFYTYLATLPIAKSWDGPLIGLFSISALIIRPIISPFLTPFNAIKVIFLGVLLTIVSLLMYLFVESLIPMIFLRILHGTAYVILASSSIALLMAFIPAKKSGQGFGIITIATLLPYAIVPFILETFFSGISLNQVYAATSVIMIPALLLLIPLKKYLNNKLQEHKAEQFSLPKGSLWINLKQKKIVFLLLSNCMVFTVFSIVLFFIKTFCKNSGVGNAGLFLSVATMTMIGVRSFFGKFFDKYNKTTLTIISLIVLSASLILLNFSSSNVLFYFSAFVYGVGVGSATPIMNSLMFLISKPKYRGLNTNLMIETIDLGFFIGPTIAGIILFKGYSQTFLLSICVLVIVFATILITPLIKKEKQGELLD